MCYSNLVVYGYFQETTVHQRESPPPPLDREPVQMSKSWLVCSLAGCMHQHEGRKEAEGADGKLIWKPAPPLFTSIFHIYTPSSSPLSAFAVSFSSAVPSVGLLPAHYLCPMSTTMSPVKANELAYKQFQCKELKQGSDLIDLRLTWRKLETSIFEDFWRHSWGFLEIFWGIWGILEKLTRCEKKIKNFHHFETNKENEVLRPIQRPNSLGGQI